MQEPAEDSKETKKLVNTYREGPLGTSYQPISEIVLPWPRRLPSLPALFKSNPGGSIRALARGRILPSQVHDTTSSVTRYVRVSTRAF